MVKRTLELSDSEASDVEQRQRSTTTHSSNQKRSRVEHVSTSPEASNRQEGEDDEEEEEVNEADGNGAADGERNENSDEEMEEVEDEEDIRKRNEKLDRMRKNNKAVGTVAEAGVIDKVDLHNFMCHKYTTVKFGPQINFLVGHNGSGKSAVLTGITMALGGNARSTNRATKGSGLVNTNEGATFAVCSVRLRNKGANAFQHAKFGDYITVERRINADVSGGYKIKNAEDRVVDTKKATLDLILDHFNIQVDNPMTVLTQDQSRQFLASSTARDKYNFFLKGTQLAQLTEEYEVIRANTELMQSTLESKKAIIPDLKEAYKAAKSRANDARAAIGQKDTIEKLKHELAWSYVDEIQESIDAAEKILEAEERRLPKIQDQLAKYLADEEAAKTEEDTINEALRECTLSIVKTERIELLKASIKKNQDRMKEFHQQVRTTTSTIERMQASLKDYNEKIAAEHAKLARDIKAERQPILDQIEELQNENAELAIDIQNSRLKAEEADQNNSTQASELPDLKRNIQKCQDEKETARGRIRNLSAATNNPYNAYDPQMHALVNAIQKTNWNVQPLGPIGKYVTLKDRKWSPLLESFFGETLNAFVVETPADYVKLNNLKKSFKCYIPVVKRSREKGFLFAHAEPSPEHLTIHRVLDIQDALILAILVTDKKIESCALVVARAQGDTLMRNPPNNVLACFSADGYKLGGMRGGSSSVALDPWKGSSRLTSDNSQQIARVQSDIQDIDREIENLSRRKAELDRSLTESTREQTKGQTLIRNSNAKMRKNNQLIANLDSQLREEEPSNLAAIQASKADAEAELISTKDQFEILKGEKTALSVTAAPWVAEREELEAELNQASKLESKLRAKLQIVHGQRMTERNNAEQYQKKLEAQESKIEQLRAQADEMKPTLEERTEQASTICERPEVTQKKKSRKLQVEIEALQKALKEREKQQGATTEQIFEELEIRRAAASTAVKATKDLGSLINVLESAYTKRIDRWNDFRSSISSRAKMQFAFHLSNRGFSGKLHFDHTKLRLNLRVITDDNSAVSQKHKSKDAKSLSGGEKSFSTICLLLTMWEAVGCPIRCLDEFDVFMDAVNRRISMKMMIDTAKASNATQFILITPQAMGDQTWSSEVRVNRMMDPGRGQQTLNMNG